MDINALVVDDNEVNTLVLTNMLGALGMRTDQTDNGSGAVKLSQEVKYDLFFIDHIMPVMDGIQTTKQIRKSSYNQNSTIILLTSKITEQMRNQYKEAGADELYEKPLGLPDIISILKKWFPDMKADTSSLKINTNICHGDNELIQNIIETIDDIDYQTGLRYAIYNPNLFIHILEVSLKDLQSSMNIMVNSHANNSIKELKLVVHKLRNIYSNIGAIRLSQETENFEKAILLCDTSLINERYDRCIQNLESFFEKLATAIKRYQDVQIPEHKKDFIHMTDTEYEQCLIKAIYYIRRYEYDSIIKELDGLIRRGLPDNRSEFEQASKDIMNYDYDEALLRLTKLKNKTGGLPVNNE